MAFSPELHQGIEISLNLASTQLRALFNGISYEHSSTDSFHPLSAPRWSALCSTSQLSTVVQVVQCLGHKDIIREKISAGTVFGARLYIYFVMVTSLSVFLNLCTLFEFYFKVWGIQYTPLIYFFLRTVVGVGWNSVGGETCEVGTHRTDFGCHIDLCRTNRK